MGNLTGEQTVAVIAIAIGAGGGILLGMISVVSYYWQVVRVAEQNAVLKKSMIDRGFTPDDIEKVVMAGDANAASNYTAKKIADSLL